MMQERPSPAPTGGTRKWLAVGVAALISWGIFATSARRMLGVGEMAPPSLEGSAVPRPVDFGWALLDLDDRPVDFARFKGRPILLNLWATWCGPCLREMPSIAKLAASKELAGRDIAFVCVALDESAEAVRRYVKDKGWNVTVLRATSLPPAFETEGIPATFLIDREGGIASAEVGAAQWDDPSVVAFLQKLAPPGK